MSKQSKLIVTVTAIVLMLVVVVNACAPTTPTVPEKAVTIGVHGMLTGPAASAGVPLTTGSLDYAKYLNERGGIDGVRINAKWVDTRGMIPGTLTGHGKFREMGAVVEIVYMSAPTLSIVAKAQNDEIPLVIYPGIEPALITKPIRWVFGGPPGYCSEFATIMKWVKENWTQARAPRFGLLFYDHPSGWGALEAAEHVSKLGVEFVGYEVLPLLGTVDTTTELLRLAAKQPDWIHVRMTGATDTTATKDTARLELSKRGIKFIQWYGSIDEKVPIVREDLEGWYQHRYLFSPAEVEVPAVAVILEAAAKYRGKQPEQVFSIYLSGWLVAQVAVEGIRLAIEKVGLENLSGRAVRDALASMNDFDSGLLPPITMSEEKPCMFWQGRIYQIRQGRLIPVSDWMEPAYPLLAK